MKDCRAQAAREETEAEKEHDCAGEDAEYWEKLFRVDVVRREKCDEAEGKDAYGVRDGDSQTQKGGVARRAP